MGKGDRRTRRGKINRASYGNARPHTNVVTGVVAKPAAAPKAAAAPKKAAAPRKKSA
ncbi:SSU ribosomal protein S31P [Luteibacter rhizovicinus]|uniref:SSU ribosomal protein S31P n=1 Tax=Luteibacter rhizovicinus TaxID=242606 RepID=A0A4R3YTR8_9GAMM|nr:30S ribosomal protein THX [Luteibacter rhizovicinus]TCV94734.1 SSU ribosomal protein S31P [Luteibacter rhizovicinus]